MGLKRTLAMLLIALAPMIGVGATPFVVPVFAQEAVATDTTMPDMPRPRPDHNPGDAVPPAPDATQTNPDEVDVPGPPPVIAPNPAAAAIDAASNVPQPVTLTASITDGGPAITDGLVWRIFDTKTDATGNLALVAKADTATAKVQLNPGEYVIHVAYGRAQSSDTLTVAAGENTKNLVLSAGALRLNAAIDGDIAIPANLVKFDLFTAGSDTDRQVVAQGLAPNDIVTLNAGTYHVVSYFGAINAVVRADLRVEPGQLTDATLYHHAAQISFKLVSETGGEAIADVEWTVKTADGTTVFTDLGAFPATVLAQGDYLVFAKQGEKVFNRDFQVQPGSPKEIEVLTSVY